MTDGTEKTRDDASEYLTGYECICKHGNTVVGDDVNVSV
jgi:hypothetical protein